MRLALAFAAYAVAPCVARRRDSSNTARRGLDEIRKMRASAIQQELRAAGVRYDDCFEKDELAAPAGVQERRGRAEERAGAGAGALDAAPGGRAEDATAAGGRGRHRRASYKARRRKKRRRPADFDAEAEMANASKMRIKELQAALGHGRVDARHAREGGAVDAYVGALRDGKRPDAAAAGDDVFDDDVVELKTSKMPKAGAGPGGSRRAARPSAAAPAEAVRGRRAPGGPLEGAAGPVRRRRGRHAEHRRRPRAWAAAAWAAPSGAWAAGVAASRGSCRRPWATRRSWPPSKGGGNPKVGRGQDVM